MLFTNVIATLLYIGAAFIIIWRNLIIYRCKGTAKNRISQIREEVFSKSPPNLSKNPFYLLPKPSFIFFQPPPSLLLRHEGLPGLVVVEDADFRNPALRFVHYFNRRIGDIFRCPFYTVHLRLVEERGRSRRGILSVCPEIERRLHGAACHAASPGHAALSTHTR